MSNVRVKLLIPMVQAEHGKLVAYKTGDIVTVDHTQADRMITRMRAELVSDTPTAAEAAPVDDVPLIQPVRKKRGK